ncbi:hypothetical protein ACF3MZ_15510 [Paenibacillaceae bacterium WGS1546]|uniref:hypothetical protein n=1 Tax=Cohnella sp. WGS1546 TaxID=3366810 RepID=UPI00372D4D68
MNKKTAGAFIMIACALALLLEPVVRSVGSAPASGLKEAVPPADRIERLSIPAETGPDQVEPVVADARSFAPLQPELAGTNKGFEVRFDESSVSLVDTVALSSRVVHVVARSEDLEDGAGGAIWKFEAIVVEPISRRLTVHPLYEFPEWPPMGFGPIASPDGKSLLFVRPESFGTRVAYDLASLNAETGKLSVLAPRFWIAESEQGRLFDDFLLGAHLLAEEGNSGGQLLLSSFKGRMWRIDLRTGEVRTSGKEDYPAYGDLGSTPPRETIYPSPDLTRIVYQPAGTSRFEVADFESGETIGQFDFGDAKTVNDPGIVWNPEGSLFFLEYGDRDQVRAIYSDNGMQLFAQGVRFFDRDGKAAGVFELPNDPDRRMNVYGWAGEYRVWLEFYRAPASEDRDSRKLDATYKLYDIRTGKLAEYRITEDTSALKDPTMEMRRADYGAMSPVFLLADANERLLWLPPEGSQAVTDGGKLILHVADSEAGYVHEWEPRERTWKWANVDPGEIIAGTLTMPKPLAYREEWLIYERRSSSRAEYVRLDPKRDGNPEALPELSGEFLEQRGVPAWREEDAYRFDTLNGNEARAVGKSRYGKIEIRSVPGELRLVNGGGPSYYGAYSVTYTDAKGKIKRLEPLEKLSLRQEQPSSMRRFEFDGYDLLLFQPYDYRFSKGFDGGVRETFAYAVTSKGEAYRMDFKYVQVGGSERRDSSFTLDDNEVVRRTEGGLEAFAWIGERSWKLLLSPNLEERTFTVTEASDRTPERERLTAIAERYANRIEQALGLEDIALPEGRMEEERLRELFTDRAWNNPGFQRLRKDFAEGKRTGQPSRAFAWASIDARFVAPDTIRFTFTLNLWYAIGLAAHLETGLKLVDGDWIVQDFGTLETEKNGGYPGYDGLRIRDPLELF